MSTDFLESLDTKSSAIISTSSEKGKIINNFECYVVCPMNTEKATTVKVGEKATLRLPSSHEVDAEIVYIVEEEDDNRVIVFKLTDDVEELIEYREIFVDIIWWSYQGLKVSNSAILEENDISYVERSKAGYTDKIYVKVLRQNDTYSIIENYTNDELKELGIDEESIKDRKELNVYDEILLH